MTTKDNAKRSYAAISEEDISRSSYWTRDAQAKWMRLQLKDYKHAASVFVNKIKECIAYAGDGRPFALHGVVVLDETLTNVLGLHINKSTQRLDVWMLDFDMSVPWYPNVRYIQEAGRGALNEVYDHANEWLTMAEAEKEYSLTEGIVRQYVWKHRQKLKESGVIKQADKRTVLIKRGKVIRIWVQK